MAGFSSPPPRLIPPLTPRRAPSPIMSPAGRRMRAQMGSEEGFLRDLSPDTTLRAFTEHPLPFDPTRDEYKIFACIDTLTPAERDLGARVARAAQRLKSWCDEIEQWGWSGSFEQPSAADREQRRQSLELRIKEHVKDTAQMERMPDLEYWGSLLSVEVESHEVRLDEMGDELLALDIDELKEHVLDMHPSSRSRPSSAGYGASQWDYTPVDDFSFLITQTLLSALPHHFQLKDKLSSWTARVSILREAPRYLDHLKTAQKAMRLGWDAIEFPTDTSDTVFEKWKEAVDTISGVLQGKVSHLGRRLDRMLDTLEGREDCLPDDWIDVFEGVEADFGRWAHESTRRVIEFDVRRRGDFKPLNTMAGGASGNLGEHSDHGVTSMQEKRQQTLAIREKLELAKHAPSSSNFGLHSTASEASNFQGTASEPDTPTTENSFFDEGDTMDTVVHNEVEESPYDYAPVRPQSDHHTDSPVIITTHEKDDGLHRPHTPRSRRESSDSVLSALSSSSSPPSLIEESPSERNAANRHSKAPRPALNAAMSKRRPAYIATEPTIDDNVPWPPTQFSQKSRSSADELERKISDILTTIPAHIRLTSGVRADAHEARSSRAVTHKGSKGYLRATRSFSGMKSPEITLSRARQDPDSANATSGRRSGAALRGDNDIKLYHLTQPGKEQPIKLFIRRVGENGERVMVRVGGGWADLGEYLRQYAEHHGRRTASEGKFEILGLEVPNLSPSRPGSALKERPESAMTKRPGSAMTKRPGSAMAKRERRLSGGTQVGTPNTTPVKPAGSSFLRDEPPPPMPNFTSTPSLSGETSAPSTGESKRSWRGDEVGLAGPNAKKLELSDDKLEWIEGMMKQARTVSGNVANGPRPDQREDRPESRGEGGTDARGKPDFGALGKVGGTKRIFMRGGGGFSEH